MKARMLCFLLASTMTPVMAAGPDFGALIDKAEKQGEKAHAETLKSAQAGETVSFYNNDWLNLRHRKRFALAQAEVKLKKSRSQKN